MHEVKLVVEQPSPLPFPSTPIPLLFPFPSLEPLTVPRVADLSGQRRQVTTQLLQGDLQPQPHTVNIQSTHCRY